MDRKRLINVLRQAKPFFIIAGPCVLESEDIVQNIASHLLNIQNQLNIPVIFKGSFDKANRQCITSYRGPGLEKGLKLLQQVKETTGLPVCTDIHEPCQAAKVANIVDLIQIPAFLSRQTDLLLAASDTGRLVNLKKGQMLSPETMILAAKKLLTIQQDNERGTMFGYGDLIVDARTLVKLRAANGLVVQDITHSVQRASAPGSGTSISGGDREFIPTIARMAAAVGVNGFFVETHPDPVNALCDGSTMLPLDELAPLLVELKDIAFASKGLKHC